MCFKIIGESGALMCFKITRASIIIAYQNEMSEECERALNKKRGALVCSKLEGVRSICVLQNERNKDL